MTSTCPTDHAAQVVDPGEERMTVRAWAVLLVLCGALFLEGIDIAMLNVAVPSIRDELGLGTGSAHWIISAYVLGYAGFMLLGGRTADLLGRRRTFLTALAVFVLFSGLGGLAHEGWVLVLARFLTGVAAGFMTPAGLSIITTSFPEGRLRDRAVVVYGAVGAAGFVLGMVAGGVLTTIDWRWVFFAPGVLGTVLLLAGRALLRPDPPRSPSAGRFDLPGALLVTVAMVAGVYALVAIGEDGDLFLGGTTALAALLLAWLFVRVERRAPAPLVRLGILRSRGLAAANASGALYMAGYFGFQFTVTLFLQDVLGFTALETGLTFAIMGLDLLLAPLLTPLLVTRFGLRRVIAAGGLAAALSFALLLRIEPDWGYVDLLPSLLLVAVAFALAYGPLTLAATAGVAESEQGLAGGLLYTSFQFGGALGLALVTIVLAASGGAIDTGDVRAALVVPVALMVLSAAAVLARRVEAPADDGATAGS